MIPGLQERVKKIEKCRFFIRRTRYLKQGKLFEEIPYSCVGCLYSGYCNRRAPVTLPRNNHGCKRCGHKFRNGVTNRCNRCGLKREDRSKNG